MAVPNNGYSLRYIKPLSGPTSGGTAVDFVGKFGKVLHSVEMVFTLMSPGAPCLSVKGKVISSTVLNCETPPIPLDVLELPVEATVTLYIDGVDVRVEETIKFCYYIQPFISGISPKSTQLGAELPVNLTMFSPLWGTKGSMAYIWRSQLIYDNEVQSLRVKFIEVETGKSGANARSKPVSTTGTIIFKPGGEPVVQCTVPASTRPGKYHVYVSLNNGKDYTGAISGQKPIAFSVFDHPEITMLIPACTLSGEATLVRIMGSNFLDTGDVTVSFKHPNGNLLERVPATVSNSDKITCRVPRTLQLGECQMRVALNSDEAFESSPLKFTVYNAPRFETLAPTLGPARGGSRLRIYRAADAMDILESGDAVVRFRSVYGDRLVGEVSGTVSDDGKFVECSTPANPEKNSISEFLEMVYVHIAVDGTNFILCAAEFGYHSDFTISGLTKQLGPMKGGTDMEIESDVYFDPDLVPTCVVSFTEYEHSRSRDHTGFESIIPKEHSESVARTTTTEGSVLSATTEGTVFKFKAPNCFEASMDDPDFIMTRVSLSLNGQDFDQTPVNEDSEGTLFTYHRDIVFRMIQPTSGSISGGAKLKVISNVKLGDEWSPYISFRGKRDVVVRGEVVDGDVHCTTPHYPMKMGKSGFEDVHVCLSLNGFDFSGDELDASTHEASDRSHGPKKSKAGESAKDAEKIPSRERFRFHNDIEDFELSPDHGSCSGGSRVTISGYAGLIDRRGFKLDWLPDTGGPYLVQLRYIDSAGIPRSIDRQGTWSHGTIMFTTPFVQPAQQVKIAISPNRQDAALVFRSFVYVSDPKMLGISPRMAPISFATDITFELSEKVGKQCCARLRFPCGNSLDGSDVSESVPCMSISDVQGVVTCRLPLPSVHEDVPRFTAFVASHVVRSLPLEVAVDGQNYKPSGDLVERKQGMQLYYFPDVQRINPCGGPFDAAAICTLTLSRDYFIDQEQEAGENSSPIEASRNVEVKFYSPDLELELLVPAIVREGDTIELECPHFKDWPKDDTKPFKVQVWLSIRDRNFCPTGLSYLFYPQPRFTNVSPRVGHMRGGTPLVIRGERFCDLGFGQTIIKIGDERIIGTVLDDENIRCISPMLPSGKYDVQISFNGISFHPVWIDNGGPKSVPLKFIVGNIIDLNVEPQAALGPVTGGSALTIAFTGDLVSLLQKDTLMAVHFRTPRESALVEGVFSKRRAKKGGAKVLLGEVHCTTPPFETPSFATVHLSFFGMEESESAACTFTFHRIPAIALLQPSRVPTSGGSRVRAYLKIAKLLPKLSEGWVSPKVKLTLSSADADRDRLNEATLDSEYDASAGHFSLTIPAWPSAETVSLKVSLNGGVDFVVLKASSLKYFNQPPAFESIAPCGGPVLGCTELKLKLPESVVADIEGVDITVAFHFPHSATERTVFRNIDSTNGADVVLRSGLRASGSVVQCEVPECASEIDIARVLVSLNGSDFVGKRHHNTFIPFYIPFIYYEPPTIDSIEPQCCANEGGTIITIQGSGFHRLGVKYQGAKVQFITTKNVVRTIDANIVSDDIIQCVAPKIRNYDGLSRVRLSLNGQQYADICSEDGNPDSSKEIRYYHGPVLIMNVTGSCEGGEEVIFRGSKALLLPILDEGMSAHITFVSTVKSSRFTRTVEAFLKDETSATVDIACVTPKVPTPAPARIEISFKDRAETPVKETITLKLKYRYTFFPPPELVSIHPFGGPIGGGTKLLISSQYISSKKTVAIHFERSYDGDESSDDSTDSNVMEECSVPCTIFEASKPQAKLQCGLICAFPDFSELLEVTGKNSARFDLGVIINDHKYSSTLSYVAYRVPTGRGFEVNPKTIYKGPKSMLAVTLREPGFFPDEGSWVHLRLASNGAMSMSAQLIETLHVLGQVDTNGTAIFQCPGFISTGKWSCELSFNAIDYMSCGDIDVLEPALVSYVYPSKMSVQRSTRVTIGCCAASPSTASLLHGQRIRVRGMKRSQIMLSGPLEVTPLYATQRLDEQFGDKLHISHMKVTIADVDVERSTENCDIVVLLSCNGVTLPLAAPKRDDGVTEKRASEARSDVENEKTSPRPLTNPGAANPAGEKKASDFTSPSKSAKGRRQSKFLPSMPTSSRIKMTFAGSAMAASRPNARRTGSFSVITTNSAGLNASDVAHQSSPTLASDALAIEAMVQSCSVNGALDFTNKPVEINGGVIEVSVACVFRDPIKLQPTSCSIIATGEFPCKHLADEDGLFDDFTFRCALDQTVASQSQIPVTRSATFELEITPGKAPPRPDFLLRAEFPPLKDSFGNDMARVAVDLCSHEKGGPPAVMSPARHIAVFDPSSWTILGIEPTEGRANTETPVIIDVSGFEMVESVSLEIELEDGTILHADGELESSSNTVGVIRRVVRATMPALDGFTGDYIDAIIQVVTDGEVLCVSAVRFVYITSPLILGLNPTYLPHTSGGLVTIRGIGFIDREQTHALLESGDGGQWQVDPEQYNMSAVENGHQSASQMWSNDDSPAFDDDYTDGEVSASPRNGPNPYILEPLSVRKRPLNFVKNDDDRVAIHARIRFINQSSIEVHIPPHVPAKSLIICMPGTDGQEIRSSIPLKFYDAITLQPTCGNSSGGSELEISGVGFPSSSAKIHDFEAQPYVRQALYAYGKLVYSTKLEGRIAMNERKDPIVICRTQVLPAHLLSDFSFVEMATDVSFSGIDGPFTRTQLPFRIYRPLGCRKIEPATGLVPGRKADIILACSNFGGHVEAKLRIRCESLQHSFGKVIAHPTYQLLQRDTMKLILPFFTLREGGHITKLHLASAESSVRTTTAKLWTHRLSTTDAEISTGIISKGTVEVSLNGRDWFERASLPIMFAAPARVDACIPSFGTLHGGTAIEIHGENFALGRCWVGFLVRTRYHPAENAKQNIHGIKFRESHEPHKSEAALRIQTSWRRFSVLCDTRSGTALPCAIVSAFAVTSTIIKCDTPPALLGGDATVVVSVNGVDFEYVTSQLASWHKGTQCHTNFCFQQNVSISAIVTDDGVTTDRLYIHGEGFECPSTDLITVRFRAPDGATTTDDDDDDDDDESGGDGDSSSSTSSAFVGLESCSFARGSLTDEGTISCETPLNLAYQVPHRIAVSLNGVDFSNEVEFLIRNSPVIASVEPDWMLTSQPVNLHIFARNISESDSIFVKLAHQAADGTLREVIRLPGEKLESKRGGVTCELPILDPIMASLRCGSQGALLVDVGIGDDQKFTDRPLKLYFSSTLPETSSCLPAQGPSAGATIRIHGKGFCDKRKISVRLVPIPRGLFDTSKKNKVDMSNFQIEPLVMEYGAQYLSSTSLKCNLPELEIGAEYFIQVSFNRRDFSKTTRYCTYKCVSRNQATEATTSLDGGNIKRTMRNFKHMKEKLKDVGLSKLRTNLDSIPYCEIDYEATIDAALANLGSSGVASLNRADLKVVERKQQIQAIDPSLLRASTARVRRAKSGAHRSSTTAASPQVKDASVLEQMQRLVKHNPEETKRLLQKTFQTLGEPEDERLPPLEHSSQGEFSKPMVEDAFAYHRETQERTPLAEPDDGGKLLMTPGMHSEVRDEPQTARDQEILGATFANEGNLVVDGLESMAWTDRTKEMRSDSTGNDDEIQKRTHAVRTPEDPKHSQDEEVSKAPERGIISEEKIPVPPLSPPDSKTARRIANPNTARTLTSPKTALTAEVPTMEVPKAEGQMASVTIPTAPAEEAVLPAEEVVPEKPLHKLTFDQLCKEGITQLFPGATTLDLMEVWSVADPLNTGEVTLEQLMEAISTLGKVNTEIGPGDYDIGKVRDKFSRRNNELPASLYERPASVLIPFKRPKK